MKNFVQAGDVLELVAPSGGVTSGLVYKIQDLVVVATHSAAEGEIFAGRAIGVMSVPKKSADAFAQGAKVYWDDAAKEMTTTAGGNTLVGTSVDAAATGVTSAAIRWNGSF